MRSVSVGRLVPGIEIISHVVSPNLQGAADLSKSTFLDWKALRAFTQRLTFASSLSNVSLDS